MTQEEFKNHVLEYIDYNITDDKIKLEIVQNILDNITNELYQNGYVKESNSLTTSLLIINEIIENN